MGARLFTRMLSRGIGAACVIAVAAAILPSPLPAQEALVPLSAPVLVDIGEHPTYSRITFELPQPVPYRASRVGDMITLTFERPGVVGIPSTAGSAYGRITAITQTSGRDQPLAVSVGIAPGASVRHFVLGTRVVVDVTDNGATGAAAAAGTTAAAVAGAVDGVTPPEAEEPQPGLARPPIPVPRPDHVPPPAAETGAETGAETVADSTDVDAVASAESVVQQGSSSDPPEPGSQVAEAIGTEAPADAAPAGAVPADGATPPPPEVTIAQAPPAAAATPEAETTEAVTEAATPDDGSDVALAGAPDPIPEVAVDPGEERYKNGRATFDLLLPTGLAAFERAGSLYLVFAARAPIDAEVLLRQGRVSFPSLQEIPAEGGVVLRLPLDAGTYPAVGRFTTAWTVTLSQRAPRPASIALEPDLAVDENGSPQIVLPRDGTARVVRFTDPIVGDGIVAVPVAQLGAAVAEPYGFVQLDLLASYQGIVIEPKSDTLSVRIGDEGVRIDDQDGLVVSMP